MSAPFAGINSSKDTFEVVDSRKPNEERSKFDEELKSLVLESILQAFAKMGFKPDLTQKSSEMVTLGS